VNLGRSEGSERVVNRREHVAARVGLTNAHADTNPVKVDDQIEPVVAPQDAPGALHPVRPADVVIDEDRVGRRVLEDDVRVVERRLVLMMAIDEREVDRGERPKGLS